jgi:hypothetical protein
MYFRTGDWLAKIRFCPDDIDNLNLSSHHSSLQLHSDGRRDIPLRGRCILHHACIHLFPPFLYSTVLFVNSFGPKAPAAAAKKTAKTDPQTTNKAYPPNMAQLRWVLAVATGSSGSSSGSGSSGACCGGGGGGGSSSGSHHCQPPSSMTGGGTNDGGWQWQRRRLQWLRWQ